MRLKKLFSHPDVRWVNLFIRDVLLVLVILYMQITTKFNSKSVFLITGMMIVWITWQLSDYLNYKEVGI